MPWKHPIFHVLNNRRHVAVIDRLDQLSCHLLEAMETIEKLHEQAGRLTAYADEVKYHSGEG